MVRKLADDTEKKVAGTESIRSIHRDLFAACGVLIEFAKPGR